MMGHKEICGGGGFLGTNHKNSTEKMSAIKGKEKNLELNFKLKLKKKL